jgi:hypothetical protein
MAGVHNRPSLFVEDLGGMVAQELVKAFGGDDWEAVKVAMGLVEAAGLWRDALLLVRNIRRPCPAVARAFHSVWIERGHRIREHAGDDVAVLDALHVLLPPYDGGAVTLYRGESFERWNAKRCGSAWTTREEVVRMFARGLNAVKPDGGILLVKEALPGAIIAAPNEHSIYLGEYEYVVDRRNLTAVHPLERFPAI